MSHQNTKSKYHQTKSPSGLSIRQLTDQPVLIKDVTLNCSVIRTVNSLLIQKPRISWIYNNTLSVNIIEPSKKNIKAVFIEKNYSVASTVRIFNVRLIDKIEIRCESSKESQKLRLSAAGKNIVS